MHKSSKLKQQKQADKELQLEPVGLRSVTKGLTEAHWVGYIEQIVQLASVVWLISGADLNFWREL